MKKIDYSPTVKTETVQRFGKGPVPTEIQAWTPVVTNQPIRSTASHRSVSTPGGSTALKPMQQYSGSSMPGVSQLHKSNSVPVFSHAEIHDIGKMRR